MHLPVKLSWCRALFKHEWASDSEEHNARGLIITIEHSSSVVSLKPPSRGVILDLIKCRMYHLHQLLLIAILFIAVFFEWIPPRDPECLQVIHLTTCVSYTITANFLHPADETALFTSLTFMRLCLCVCERETELYCLQLVATLGQWKQAENTNNKTDISSLF